jgi:hypothetical protein
MKSPAGMLYLGKAHQIRKKATAKSRKPSKKNRLFSRTSFTLNFDMLRVNGKNEQKSVKTEKKRKLST